MRNNNPAFAGQKIVSVEEPAEERKGLVKVTLESRAYIRFIHHFECCEMVGLEDRLPELQALVGDLFVGVEEVSNDHVDPNDPNGEWYFYNVTTQKSEAQLRFYGTSNGYYGTEVNVEYFDADGKRTYNV